MGWEGKEKQRAGNSLVVQWLGLDAFFAGAWAWSLVRELRSHKLCDVAKVKKKERKEKGRQAKRSQEEQGGSQGGEIFLCGMTHLGNWERYCSPRNFLSRNSSILNKMLHYYIEFRNNLLNTHESQVIFLIFENCKWIRDSSSAMYQGRCQGLLLPQTPPCFIIYFKQGLPTWVAYSMSGILARLWAPWGPEYVPVFLNMCLQSCTVILTLITWGYIKFHRWRAQSSTRLPSL